MQTDDLLQAIDEEIVRLEQFTSSNSAASPKRRSRLKGPVNQATKTTKRTMKRESKGADHRRAKCTLAAQKKAAKK